MATVLQDMNTGIDTDHSTDAEKVANFNRPDNGTIKKVDGNTFLWDYYYKHNSYDDLNSDKYPDSYYSTSRTYENYPLLACATPYIIGFPGERYYEFDLSGNFEAKTASATIPTKLSAQVITFVSPLGEHIHVSETEMSGKHETGGGYDFVPNFTSRTLDGVAYILNTDDTDVDKRGNSYKKVANGAQTIPFRPYFVVASSGNSAAKRASSIIFSNETTQLEGNDKDLNADDKAYDLDIYAKRKKIVVTSNLRESTEVRIVNAAGMTISIFTIEPGETVETRINNAGIFIVQSTDGRHLKKLAIK